MKIISKDALKTIKNDYILDNYDLSILEEWQKQLNDGFSLLVLENEKDITAAVYDDLISNETLEFITPQTLASNLKKDFQHLDESDIQSIQTMRDPFKILKVIVDVDGVIDDILSYDGVGVFLNRYDSNHLELTPKDDPKATHTITLY